MDYIKGAQLYEGKAKRLYATNVPGVLLQEFKDDATAFNGVKRDTIAHKGELNTAITSALFTLLTKEGVPNHFIEQLNATTMAVQSVKIIPVELIVRNIAAGSLVKRYAQPEGKEFSEPIIEHCFKSDEHGDPLMNEAHIVAFGFATRKELDTINTLALKINTVLKAFFAKKNLKLVDFKLEFGRASDDSIILADEISPDTCRFWDATTNKKLDKDRFRQDLGGVIEAYEEVKSRILA